MKTLVIGGAGYIGSVLTRQLLDEGGEVTVLDNLRFGEESLGGLSDDPNFRLCVADLRDQTVLDELMPGHDAVVLLAAIVGEPACNREPELALEVNLSGARGVLQATKRNGVPRFVFASTCSNYGVQREDEMVDETAPLQPISTYAESKVLAEKDILAACDETFSGTVLRLSTAFGVSPRMRFDLMVSDFALAAIRDGKVVVFGEQFWRPFVHVADISAAIRLVLSEATEKVSGQVFNVGRNDNNLRKQDLAEMVVQHVPGSKLEYVERNQDPRSYRVRFDRIEEQLGFHAAWTVEQGVKEVVEQLQSGRWPDTAAKCYYN
jgi:nucleoside-diphosphate-sugar epimerase